MYILHNEAWRTLICHNCDQTFLFVWHVDNLSSDAIVAYDSEDNLHVTSARMQASKIYYSAIVLHSQIFYFLENFLGDVIC